MPMFWRLFLANAVALAVAFLALAFGLVTVSVPPTSDQLFILILGFASLLLINAAMASYGLTAVSYTHLDVYKRQMLNSSPSASITRRRA